MSIFTEQEIAYLQSQRLGRLATIGPSGMPHVVPVAFRYNPEHETIDIGGHRFADRRKYRDMQRDPRVAFVVDDVQPPWRPRMIEIRGTVEFAREGKSILKDFSDEMVRIRPERIVAFGIDGEVDRNARSISGRDAAARSGQRPLES
jgi:pyridoxamine 5'-phosphate oxidase family protein